MWNQGLLLLELKIIGSETVFILPQEAALRKDPP
jgi:hypothetical protein